jgi:peptide-methionine (S)-S-oxide reductase
MQTGYFAGGCFWCVEAIFQRVEAVEKTTSGYCNGALDNPTYADICTGKSGHTEVVKIEFDEAKISFQALLNIFFATHNPTMLNQQGSDCGAQYRSAVFYLNARQQTQALDAIKPIKGATTAVEKLDKFYPAEDYHQNYYNNNPNQPYCRALIAPKLQYYFALNSYK